jgi:hypothetical protein
MAANSPIACDSPIPSNSPIASDGGVAGRGDGSGRVYATDVTDSSGRHRRNGVYCEHHGQ